MQGELKVAQFCSHGLFVLVAVFGQPRLAPHVWLFGDDAAVFLDVPLQGIQVAGEHLNRGLLSDTGAWTDPSSENRATVKFRGWHELNIIEAMRKRNGQLAAAFPARQNVPCSCLLAASSEPPEMVSRPNVELVIWTPGYFADLPRCA